MTNQEWEELKRLVESAKEREENGNLFEAAYARKSVTDALLNDTILDLLAENQRMRELLTSIVGRLDIGSEYLDSIADEIESFLAEHS